MIDWAHAPVHRLNEQGCYIVTAGTYRKIKYLSSPERLQLIQDTLFVLANEFQWSLQAWAIMANHYHFVGLALGKPQQLSMMISKLHMLTAKRLNEIDCTPGRKVWFQYWDTRITYQPSYLARLRYVHQNPVHHGVAVLATDYAWCSARWFERTAEPAFRKTVESFKTDSIKIVDDF